MRCFERHHLVAQMPRNGVLALLHGIGFAHLGTRVDRGFARALQCLAIARFGLHHAGLSPVEQRQLEADFVAALLRLLVGAVVDDAEFQHVDEARAARQPQIASPAPRSAAGSSADRCASPSPAARHPAAPARHVGQIGQALGQLQPCRRRCRPIRRTRRSRACSLHLFGTRHRQCRIGIERLLARLLQLAPVAHLRHAAREFGAGFGGAPSPAAGIARSALAATATTQALRVSAASRSTSSTSSRRVCSNRRCSMSARIGIVSNARQTEMQATLPFHFGTRV